MASAIPAATLALRESNLPLLGKLAQVTAGLPYAARHSLVFAADDENRCVRQGQLLKRNRCASIKSDDVHARVASGPVALGERSSLGRVSRAQLHQPKHET